MLPLVSVMRRWVLADLPILSRENVPEVGFAMLCATGFASGSRRVQGVIVATFWFGVAYSSAYPWFQPGAVVN
jgi:hypothetical protein